MKLWKIPYTFTVMNFAAVAGLTAFLTGRDVWRRETQCSARKL